MMGITWDLFEVEKIMRSKWIKDNIYDLTRIRDIPMERSGMFRMDRNERTWPFHEEILEDIRRRITSETLTNYPEMESIYHRLSSYLGVDDDQIYLHSGSDLVIKSIFETYIGQGDRVLMQNPSYAMYGVYARMYGAYIIEQSCEKDLRFDIDSYCEIIKDSKPKMVIFENPNGYIGYSFSLNKVKEVIDAAHDVDALILIDEAYIDYIQESSVQDLVSEYDNLIIVRTFSKAWGLAGMRAGYALSNKLLISEIFKVMPMHELTSATIIAINTILDHSDEMKEYIGEVKKAREYFVNQLDNMNILTAQSNTHFVTAALGKKMDADKFRTEAHKRKYFVRRPFGQELLKDWVRIGLLPMSDMEKFVNFLRDFIDKEK